MDYTTGWRLDLGGRERGREGGISEQGESPGCPLSKVLTLISMRQDNNVLFQALIFWIVR